MRPWPAGPRVLEAGVGTGLSLGYYPRQPRSTGSICRRTCSAGPRTRSTSAGSAHVKSLQVMDVTHLTFPDGMFDAVTAQFIITLVPEPEKRPSTEFARVLKPGGEIVLANHFGQPSGPVAALEELASPVVKAIGWSSAFKAARVETGRAERGAWRWSSSDPLFPAGFFKLMRDQEENLRSRAVPALDRKDDFRASIPI